MVGFIPGTTQAAQPFCKAEDDLARPLHLHGRCPPGACWCFHIRPWCNGPQAVILLRDTQKSSIWHLNSSCPGALCTRKVLPACPGCATSSISAPVLPSPGFWAVPQPAAAPHGPQGCSKGSTGHCPSLKAPAWAPLWQR